jgi:hypothetical protein
MFADITQFDHLRLWEKKKTLTKSYFTETQYLDDSKSDDCTEFKLHMQQSIFKHKFKKSLHLK